MADEIVSFRPAARSWQRLIIPTLLGCAIGVWFAYRSSSNVATAPAPQLESPPPPPSARGVVAIPESSSAPPEPIPVVKPESSTAPLAPAKVVRKGGPQAPASKSVAPKEKPAHGAPARPTDPVESEPDVGF